MLAGLLIGGAGGGPLDVDRVWSGWMSAVGSPAATWVAQLLAVVGGTVGMAIVTAALVVLLLVLRHPRLAIGIGASVGLAALASSSIKLLVQRPRPGAAVSALTTYSYPSGHTTAAAALAAAFALAIPLVAVRVAAAGWVLLMAASRTYLHVHWLSDVLAGAVLGASVALGVQVLIRVVLRRVAARRRRRLASLGPSRPSS